MSDTRYSYGLFQKELSINVELFIVNCVGLDIGGINKSSYRLVIKSSVAALSSYLKRSVLKSPAIIATKLM